jgi:hypothetical protein
MKQIGLILLMASFLQANCQDMAKKLMNKTWYATGKILQSEKVLLHSVRPSAPGPEIKFLDDHNFQLKEDTVSDFSFVCLYQITGDKVRIYYTERIEPQKGAASEKEISHYYKVKALQNNTGFELSPIKSADFK